MLNRIRGRVLLIMLLPSLMVSTLLGAYLTYSRIEHLEQQLMSEGRMAATYLTATASHALSTGNHAALASIATTAVESPIIAAVAVSDLEGQTLLRSGAREAHNQDALTSYLLRLFLDSDLPLSLREAVYSDPTADREAPLLGWVTVDLTVTPLAAQQAGTLAAGTLAMLIALFIAGAYALLGSLAIGRTADELVATIRRVQQGDLEARVKSGAGGELGRVGRALNHMARSLQHDQFELQQKVEQTTSELRETLEAVEIQNVELDLARKRALEASKVKSEFLANMSHEIRTPINGILGFADLLTNTQMDEEQRDYVNTIKESCSSLLAIVNDILDFSKIEAGKMVIDSVAFDLRDCVEEVLSLLAPTAYGKGLELVHLIYADVPLKLYGDPVRIRQILTNLAHNAIKFTPSGRVVVRVMLDEETDQEATLRISVTDTGIGLSEADQKRLFKAFGQADTSITRRFGGAGLGLIISRKLLEQMGGSIGLESEPGHGSTFWFTLRCLKQRDVPGSPAERHENALQGRRVLIYDEEPLARLALRHVLQAWGARTIEVDDRHSLLPMAGTARIDAAVLGLSRADLNNHIFPSLATQLKKTGVPIMALASTVDRAELRSLLQQGAQVALTKALRRQTLYREFCRVLSPEPLQAPTAPPELNLPAPKPPQRKKQQPADGALKVLVVDDNQINRKLVTTILSNYAVAVHEARDGKEAVEAARSTRFDLIFMDIHMPTLSGEMATREIRALDGPQPRIIALTANAMPGERERLLAEGMDDCLIKPITEEQVAKAILGLAPSPEVPTTPPSGKDKQALAADLRDMLLSELPEHRKAIQQAFRRNQLEQLKDAVHKLHGAASVCRLKELKTCCAELEQSLKRGERVLVPEQTKKLLSAIDALITKPTAVS